MKFPSFTALRAALGAALGAIAAGLGMGAKPNSTPSLAQKARFDVPSNEEAEPVRPRRRGVPGAFGGPLRRSVSKRPVGTRFFLRSVRRARPWVGTAQGGAFERALARAGGLRTLHDVLHS